MGNKTGKFVVNKKKSAGDDVAVDGKAAESPVKENGAVEAPQVAVEEGAVNGGVKSEETLPAENEEPVVKTEENVTEAAPEAVDGVVDADAPTEITTAEPATEAKPTKKTKKSFTSWFKRNTSKSSKAITTPSIDEQKQEAAVATETEQNKTTENETKEEQNETVPADSTEKAPVESTTGNVSEETPSSNQADGQGDCSTVACNAE